MDSRQKGGQQRIDIELPPDKADGTYANLAAITHSPAEFVIDFIRLLPGLPKARVQARIIMTPPHIKSLMLALQDNIKKYEAQHGEIQVAPIGANRPFGFQTPGDEKN